MKCNDTQANGHGSGARGRCVWMGMPRASVRVALRVDGACEQRVRTLGEHPGVHPEASVWTPHVGPSVQPVFNTLHPFHHTRSA
eukprot:72617-Prymnesium_polylepis.1